MSYVQAQLHTDIVPGNSGYIPGHGDTVWKDGVTGFLFRTTDSDLIFAEKNILETVSCGKTAFICDLYRALGIEYDTPIGQMFGWSPHTRIPAIIIDAEYISGEQPIGHIRYNACLMNQKGYPVDNGRIFLEKMRAPI